MHGWRKADHSQAWYNRVLETAWMCHLRGAFYIINIAFGISAGPIRSQKVLPSSCHTWWLGPEWLAEKAEANNKQE